MQQTHSKKRTYLLNIPLRMLDEPLVADVDDVVFLFCFPNLGLPEVEGRAITPLLPVQVGNPDSARKHCLRDSLEQNKDEIKGKQNDKMQPPYKSELHVVALMILPQF